jgi:hypothetical protein
MQAEMKVNDMRASRTHNVLEAGAVAKAESNKILIARARLMLSSGVCVIGMYENTQSRNLFEKAIGKVFYNSASIKTSPTWMEAFEELNSAINNLSGTKKIVIFIDELPWMATRRSRILQALDYYWNNYWLKNKRLKLVICGSSASWIIKNIIYNKGGLHNRYTRCLLIKPFSLHETKEFLVSRDIKINDKQILQLYMAIGGVPHYLDKAKRGLSAAQDIENLYFRENGILFSEFEKLFKSLFGDAKVYIELIRIISTLREGVTRSYVEEKSKLTKKNRYTYRSAKRFGTSWFYKVFLTVKTSTPRSLLSYY